MKAILVLAIGSAAGFGLLILSLLLISQQTSSGRIAYASQYRLATRINLFDLRNGLRRTVGAGNYPVWSPDGNWLAYAGGRQSNRDIYLTDAQGHTTYNLTPDSPLDIAPVWSPDSRALLFDSMRDGNWDIYRIDLDCYLPGLLVGWLHPACHPQNLTHHLELDSNGAWSPDGREIAFVSTRDEKSEIYRMAADGSQVRRLTTNADVELGPLAWSPDGRYLAYVVIVSAGNWEVFVMNADGSHPRNLTRYPDQDSNPRWSPDSSRLLISSRRSGNFEVILLSLEDGTATNLSNHPAEDLNARWSPDGRQVIFQSTRDGFSSLYLIAADCDRCSPQRLTFMRESNHNPDWAD